MTNFQRFELYLKIFKANRIEIRMRHCAFGLASSWPNCLGRSVLALRPTTEVGKLPRRAPGDCRWHQPSSSESEVLGGGGSGHARHCRGLETILGLGRMGAHREEALHNGTSPAGGERRWWCGPEVDGTGKGVGGVHGTRAKLLEVPSSLDSGRRRPAVLRSPRRRKSPGWCIV
jgi:hypothetical protein